MPKDEAVREVRQEAEGSRDPSKEDGAHKPRCVARRAKTACEKKPVRSGRDDILGGGCGGENLVCWRGCNRKSGGKPPHSKKDEEKTQDPGTKPVPGAPER